MINPIAGDVTISVRQRRRGVSPRPTRTSCAARSGKRRGADSAWRGGAVWLFVVAAVSAAGCVGNPIALRNENVALRQELADRVARDTEQQTRIYTLDADNQQLQSLLAQEQQRALAYQNALDRTRQELSQVQSELNARARATSPSEPPPSRGLPPGPVASGLPLLSIPGAELAYDQRGSEAIRIRLDSARLFDSGSATLRAEARPLLEQVAAALRSEYAGALVGIEGHTDSDPIRRSRWRNNHDLSVQRALSVYEYLVDRAGVPSDRLYVAGYGPNEPIVPNTTDANKARNRRVELLIYPRRIAARP